MFETIGCASLNFHFEIINFNKLLNAATNHMAIRVWISNCLWKYKYLSALKTIQTTIWKKYYFARLCNIKQYTRLLAFDSNSFPQTPSNCRHNFSCLFEIQFHLTAKKTALNQQPTLINYQNSSNPSFALETTTKTYSIIRIFSRPRNYKNLHEKFPFIYILKHLNK